MKTNVKANIIENNDFILRKDGNTLRMYDETNDFHLTKNKNFPIFPKSNELLSKN